MLRSMPSAKIPRLNLTLLALALLALGALRAQSPEMILTNGKIITVDERFSVAQAAAIRGGRFLAVGSNQSVSRLAVSEVWNCLAVSSHSL